MTGLTVVEVKEMAENDVSQMEQVQATAPVTSESEKILKQSEVNELIGKVKHTERQKGYEEGYQKALSSLGNMQDAPKPQAAPNIEELVKAQIDKMKSEDMAQQAEMQRQQHWNGVLTQLKPKVDDAAKKYNDYDTVTSNIDFIKHAPEVLAFANTVDNAGDVLYDLAKNPLKLAQIQAARSPEIAVAAIKQISDSIKMNEQAQSSNSRAREPLSQIRPSPVGTGQGQMSIRDFKAKYRK